MNAFQIKVLAIILMIIDHMGLFFFPQFFWLRIIGRLAFPLFAWLIANGAHHTRNIKKYLTRLFLFAVLSQLPFMIANRVIDPQFHELNVLFTLFLGLVAIYGIQKTTNWAQWVFITLICALIAQSSQTDYGGFGVAVIVVFYMFFTNFRRLLIAQSILFVGQYLFLIHLASIEIFGLCSLVFVWLYNDQLGPRTKYLFYIIYPLQYVVYYFLLIRLLALPI
jgi:TraX protein